MIGATFCPQYKFELASASHTYTNIYQHTMYMRGTWGTGVLPVNVDEAETQRIRTLILSRTHHTLKNDSAGVAITTIGADADMPCNVSAFIGLRVVIEYISNGDPAVCKYIRTLKLFNTTFAGHDYIISVTSHGGMLHNNRFMRWIIYAINIAISSDQKGAVLCRLASTWQWREMSLDDLSGLNARRIISLYSQSVHTRCDSYIIEASARKRATQRAYANLPMNVTAHSKVKMLNRFSKVSDANNVYIFSVNPLVKRQMYDMHLRMMESFVPQDKITIHLDPPADEDGLVYNDDDD